VSAPSDHERYRRVTEEGSNRKRDIAGYRRVKAAIDAERRRQVEQDPRAAMAWEKAKRQLKRQVPSSTYAMWLEPLDLACVEGERIILSAPPRLASWVGRRYLGLLRDALDGREVEVVQR
jgi:hypothetical protein